MGSPVAMMEVATSFLTWTRQLGESGPTTGVLRLVRPQVAVWNENDELRGRLVHTSSLLPPPGEDVDVPTGDVAQAFHADIQRLAAIEDQFARNVFEATDKKLVGIIGTHPPSVRNGVLRRPSSLPPPTDPVERQMVEALRLYVARAMHDANNTLSPILSSIHESKENAECLLDLAVAHKDRLPEGVRDTMVAYVADIGKRVDDIKDLGLKTAAFIRNIQELICPPKDAAAAAADFLRIRLLFEQEGLVAQIALLLVDLLSGIREIDGNIEELRQIARDHGHLVPEPVVQEGLELLRTIDEEIDTYRDLVQHIVEMFRFLQRVAKDINSAAPEVVDLNGYLSQKTLQMVMGKGVEVFLGLDPGPCLVYGIPIQIWQVLINLLSNARDAMQDRGALTVATGRASSSEAVSAAMKADWIVPEVVPGDFVRLSVTDTGHGIPDDILPRIFQPNFSGKQSSGLGLDATLTIVSQMGGFILVETATQALERRRRGTAFSIYLPRHP